MRDMKMTRRGILQQAAVASGAAVLAGNANAQGPGGRGRGPVGPPPETVSLPDTQAWKRLYPEGFRNERIKTSGAEINAVIGGSGPPLLLFHGAPDSLITWRLIAPDLAKEYTLVMCDLRGYGDSSKPKGGGDHSDYSKRPMALDGVEVMKHLGFNQFRMVGHDRGGRVGRRMALDHPDAVQKLAVFDIVPAHYLYGHAVWNDAKGQTHAIIEFVRAYPHWFNQLAPEPGPEYDLIRQYAAQAATASDDVPKEYARVRNLPGFAHAQCEDYRASASIDLKNDDADIKAGKKIQCPLLALWAGRGAMGIYDVLGIWKEEGVNVTGKVIPAGSHNLQESAPKETLAELQTFLKG
jgi:haloacetate dehalogenase